MTTDYSQYNNALQEALNNSYQKMPHQKSGYQRSAGITYQVPKTWKRTDTPITGRVCYVVATWSGPRRAGNGMHAEDPTQYLVKHFEQLASLEHDLNQIILATPHNPEEPDHFKSYIDSLGSEVCGTPLQILRRENIGQSYGSYSDAFLQNPDFDYYIFIEDDYVPVIDNFDNLLVQMFQHSPECGYLCSYAHNRPPDGPHAAISNGISSKAMLKKVADAFSCLPYGGDSTTKYAYSASPQLEFSRAFMRVHSKIYDYLSYFRAPFNEAGKLVTYGNPQLPSLIDPIQFL